MLLPQSFLRRQYLSRGGVELMRFSVICSLPHRGCLINSIMEVSLFLPAAVNSPAAVPTSGGICARPWKRQLSGTLMLHAGICFCPVQRQADHLPGRHLRDQGKETLPQTYRLFLLLLILQLLGLWCRYRPGYTIWLSTVVAASASIRHFHP